MSREEEEEEEGEENESIEKKANTELGHFQVWKHHIHAYSMMVDVAGGRFVA